MYTLNSPSPTQNKTFRFEKQPRRCKTSLEQTAPPLPSNPPVTNQRSSTNLNTQNTPTLSRIRLAHYAYKLPQNVYYGVYKVF